MVQDKRRKPRYSCSGTADLFIPGYGTCASARIQDVSVLGCRLALLTPCELSVGDIFEVAFEVNQLPFRVRGQLKVSAGPNILGIEFLSPSPRTMAYLQDLVVELAVG